MASEFHAYKRRWIYLFAVCLVNFSNGNTWITYAAITFYTNEFYGNKNAALLFCVIFMALSIPVGLLACWWTDRFGLKSAFHIGALTNFIGNAIRFAGSGVWFSKSIRFPLAFAGQTVAAFAQPFVMFLPTKLAAYWFPRDQRVIANTLSSMSNPIGIAVMYSISPLLVRDSRPAAFAILTGVCASLAAISVCFGLFVTRSVPPTPVSASRNSDIKIPSFIEGVKRCLRSKMYWVLAICLGGGVGLFNGLYNNLQPALCTMGYSASFNGGMGTLLIVSGLVGAVISGMYVDKTGKFEQTMKLAFLMAGIAACSLTISINYESVESWVTASIFFFGACGFAIYPIGLEMGVEVTFPVAETTSTGLIVMIGQIQGIIYVILTNMFVGKPNNHQLALQTCTNDDSNLNTVVTWSVPFMIWCGCVWILIILFVAFFWPNYRRRDYEAARNVMEQSVTPLH
ncbi:transporter, major facilitator family protein [Dictyocaulus viviparus]|uniref:Transporter, major facilitator family protein n=1 Tax=Dictyocaulus viviparus TaxID=29172 RepID=A0A0D8XJN1_DICVI|nr:transporter, major facilitator family protein [Dictyocaulus viviparus]